ncbi:MAG TPA: DUF1810 domain-containing protein [Methylibium sp.]|nr:DUF1810 domain-containing protein [Methylibium sp.]
MTDPFDLERFVRAQAPVYDAALAELQAGRKRSHWMWFVFPQHRALGRSATALRYGMGSVDEALAYWRHPLLGPRLRACCDALLGLSGLTAHEILGAPDDLKLRSCMTLFAQAVPQEPLFRAVLARYHGGEPDPLTLEVL